MQNDEVKLPDAALEIAARAVNDWQFEDKEQAEYEWHHFSEAAPYARKLANTAIQAYLRTLSAIPSTVSGETKSNYPEIPDGWRLVPIEPTDEQIAAGLESLASSTGEPILHIVRDALFAYRSMLAASPANPAETQAVEVGK